MTRAPRAHRPRIAAAFAALALVLAGIGMTAGCSGNATGAGTPTASDSASQSSSSPTASPDGTTTASATPSTDTASVAPLHVQGARLLDEHNEPRQLRGVSTHGIAWYPQYVNQDLFHTLKTDWGINTVRIAMYTAENGGYLTDGDQSALRKLVHTGVDAAIAEDLYVIVDWHTLSDNNPLPSAGKAKEFFSEISHDYAGVPNVLYEICNEPNGSTTWAQVKQYAEQVIPAIRANSKDAVVLVGTPTWSQDIDAAQQDPLTGMGNVMYTMHFYAAEHHEELRAKLVHAVESGFPVFVSEFGITEASGDGRTDTSSATAWLNTLDKYDISYIMWNLSNKQESSAIFTTGEARHPTVNDLSASAAWYREYLRTHRANANR